MLFKNATQTFMLISAQENRPRMVLYDVDGGTIANMKVIKPIAHGFSIPGSNIKIKNHYVDAIPNNGTRDTSTSFPFVGF